MFYLKIDKGNIIMKKIVGLVLGCLFLTGCSVVKTETVCEVLYEGISYKTSMIANNDELVEFKDVYTIPIADEKEYYGEEFDLQTILDGYANLFELEKLNKLDGVKGEITSDDENIILSLVVNIREGDFQELMDNDLIEYEGDVTKLSSLSLEQTLAGFEKSEDEYKCETTEIE